ncbi:MAG: VWA domain-containing protein [Bacteroidota bacterium]
MRLLLSGFFLLSLVSLCAQSANETERVFYEHAHLDGAEKQLQGLLSSTSTFGTGVAALGDLDGDGHTEVAIGDPAGNGKLHILFVDSAAHILRTQTITAGKGGFTGKLTASGGFGTRIEALGDWDGDGIPDVAVGEPRGKLGVLMYGKVWLLMLTADGSVKSQVEIHGRTEGLTPQLARDRLFGQDIARLPDLDGNGQADLLVGAPDLVAKGTGSVWVLLMASPQTVLSAHSIEKGKAGLGSELRKGDQFGFAVETIGDLDGDGRVEVAVGAPTDDASGQNQGAVYRLSLDQNGQVSQEVKWTQGTGRVESYLEVDDWLGTSLALVGDVQGDPFPELAVGTFRDDDGGKDKGAIYVWSLTDTDSLGPQHKISETSRNFEGEFPLKYQWGYSVSPLGDLNKDGRPDLLVNGQSSRVERSKGSFWMLFPAEYPDRLKQRGTWAAGAGQFSRQDSMMLYAGAKNAEDSAKVDSLYDLSGYAPNNLVFILDVSASMSKPQRLPLLRDAFIELLAFMRPEDRISVITYSGKATLQLDGVPAIEQEKIARTISELKSQGETKPGKALEKAYAQAEAHFIEGGNNRLIMATDGGFDFRELDKPLEKLGTNRIPLSVFYFGKQPEWKLREMEKIAYSGFGNAAYITQGTVNGALLREVKMIRKKKLPEEKAPEPDDN